MLSAGAVGAMVGAEVSPAAELVWEFEVAGWVLEEPEQATASRAKPAKIVRRMLDLIIFRAYVGREISSSRTCWGGG